MRANVVIAIERFIWGIGGGVVVFFFIWVEPHVESFGIIATIGMWCVLITSSLISFFCLGSAPVALIFGLDIGTYRCGHCNRELNLWNIKVNKHFHCPSCKSLHAPFGGLFHKKHVRYVGDLETGKAGR